MLEAPHFSPHGVRRSAAFALPAETFDGRVHEPSLHQAVRAYLNNQRQGTAATKTRSFVSGGNQKPWKQKGTGRARQGSIRAPHWRGGGTVFGPHPRDYRTELPRKAKQLARHSALNARAAEGRLIVVERLQFEKPRTAWMAELLARLELAGKKTLILTHGVNEAVYLSGRNIQSVRVMPFAEAAAYDILWAETIVAEEGAITGEVPEVTDAGESLDVRQGGARKPRRKAPKAGAAAEGEEKKPARKTRKKAAARPAARAAPKKKKAAKKPAAKKKSAKKAAKKPAAKKKGSK